MASPAVLTKLCPQPDCTNYQPCPIHITKPWETSRRRERTVSGWQQQRRARWIINHYDTLCHVCGRPGANQVDHVLPWGECDPAYYDTLDNLRPIHAVPCHERKTLQEAERGRLR